MSDEERQLDELFTAYRRACPAPEPSPRFLPDIWNKIEARRSMTLSLRRWTGAFVTAAALCLAAAEVAKEALATGRTIREVVLEKSLLNAEELDGILDPKAMTEPRERLDKEQREPS